jgi:cyclopentanol dehydrogenase
MAGRVADKVALVTGAGSGMGRAHALALAGEGAAVVVTDRDAAGLEGTAATLAAAGHDALALSHDVTREEDWKRVMDAALARHGRLDVLVNNAGIALAKSVQDTTVEEWDRVMAVNARGVFLGCREAAAAMRETGGSIVNVSSVYGIVGGALAAAYCASKGAVRLLTKAAAVDLAQLKIRVNSIHPGVIRTAMTEGLFADAQASARFVARQLQRRAAEPGEVSAAVLFLASDESSFVTGAELVVDGGWLAR